MIAVAVKGTRLLAIPSLEAMVAGAPLPPDARVCSRCGPRPFLPKQRRENGTLRWEKVLLRTWCCSRHALNNARRPAEVPGSGAPFQCCRIFQHVVTNLGYDYVGLLKDLPEEKREECRLVVDVLLKNPAERSEEDIDAIVKYTAEVRFVDELLQFTLCRTLCRLVSL
eukprot:4879625-Pyramimonas_sp.AAC.1